MLYCEPIIGNLSVFVSIHPRNQLIRNYYTNSFVEYRIKPDGPIIKYQNIIVKSLPKPYETNCFDYNSIGFKSRKHCIDSCRENELRKYYPGQFPGTYLSYNLSSVEKIINLRHIYENDWGFDHKIAVKCRDMCGLRMDCTSVYYRSEVVPATYDYNGLFLNALPPEPTQLVYTHSPKIIFEEFVSYIASYVSLWFGFSFLMVSNAIYKSFVYLKNNLFVNLFVNYRQKVFKIKINNKIIAQNKVSQIK